MNSRKGFTLAEILVALGILAIGMAMVAAIFPAAMEFNRVSHNSTLGTIICENAFVVSELMLTQEIVTSTSLEIYVDDNDDKHIYSEAKPYYLKKDQQRYPMGKADARTGFAMMARKVPNTGAFQIVTVAYRKTDKDNTVELVPVSCTFGTGNDKHLIKTASPANLRIGTPLINRANGDIAFVDSVNIKKDGIEAGSKGTMKLPPGRSMSNGSYYVLMERNPTGGVIDSTKIRRSPAIGAMSKMTGLRSDPQPNE